MKRKPSIPTTKSARLSHLLIIVLLLAIGIGVPSPSFAEEEELLILINTFPVLTRTTLFTVLFDITPLENYSGGSFELMVVTADLEDNEFQNIKIRAIDTVFLESGETYHPLAFNRSTLDKPRWRAEDAEPTTPVPFELEFWLTEPFDLDSTHVFIIYYFPLKTITDHNWRPAYHRTEEFADTTVFSTDGIHYYHLTEADIETWVNQGGSEGNIYVMSHGRPGQGNP